MNPNIINLQFIESIESIELFDVKRTMTETRV